jgi:hypothetical protein
MAWQLWHQVITDVLRKDRLVVCCDNNMIDLINLTGKVLVGLSKVDEYVRNAWYWTLNFTSCSRAGGKAMVVAYRCVKLQVPA